MSDLTSWLHEFADACEIVAAGRWPGPRTAARLREVADALAAAKQQGQAVDCHCATCTCAPGMTPAVRFDTSPAAQEGAVRDHLIALGWTPPGAQQPAAEALFMADSVHNQAMPGTREGGMVVLETDAAGKPTIWCDPEIVDLVRALNNGGLRTVASCSGHGGPFGIVTLKDGRELLVLPDFDTARKAERALAAALAACAQQQGQESGGEVIQRHVVTKYRDGSVHVADVAAAECPHDWGQDEAHEDWARCYKCGISRRKPIAQQPAAVDEARSGSSIMDGAVSFVEALAAQRQEPTT